LNAFGLQLSSDLPPLNQREAGFRGEFIEKIEKYCGKGFFKNWMMVEILLAKIWFRLTTISGNGECSQA
jgi:hypothetical protein